MSIARIVEEYVLEQPMLAMALEEDILNYTACAQKIKKIIERRVGRSVSIESILMALRRLHMLHVKSISPEIKKAIERSSYSIYSGITDLIIDYELVTLKKIIRATIERKIEGEIVTFIIGTKYASLLTDKPEVVEHIEASKDVEVVKKFENLVIFRILLNKRDVNLPGLVALFTREFAKAGVSLIELESSYTEIGFVIEEKDIKKAIDAYFFLKEKMKSGF